MTSMKQPTGKEFDIDKVKEKVKACFQQVFLKTLILIDEQSALKGN